MWSHSFIKTTTDAFRSCVRIYFATQKRSSADRVHYLILDRPVGDFAAWSPSVMSDVAACNTRKSYSYSRCSGLSLIAREFFLFHFFLNLISGHWNVWEIFRFIKQLQSQVLTANYSRIVCTVQPFKIAKKLRVHLFLGLWLHDSIRITES